MEAKDTERLIRQILRESATERAPEGFADQVMDRIGSQPVPATVTRPLIPGWGWLLIAALVTTLVLWALAGTGLSAGPAGPMEWLSDWSASVKLPRWELPELSRPFAYGGIALIAFSLLHMAWIRRYIHARWSY